MKKSITIIILLYTLFLFTSCNSYKTWYTTTPYPVTKPIDISEEISAFLEKEDWKKTKVLITELSQKYYYSFWSTKNGAFSEFQVDKRKLNTDFHNVYLNEMRISNLEEYSIEIKKLKKGIHTVSVFGNFYGDLNVYLDFWDILENSPNSNTSKIITYYKGDIPVVQMYFKKR